MKNNMLVKKSIFKQENYKIVYEFVALPNNRYGHIKHKLEKINEFEIFICNLEMPLLDKEEEFYIEELNRVVKIIKRVRSSKENVCYYIEPKYIKDEKSKTRCEKLQDNFNMFEKEREKFKTENRRLQDILNMFEKRNKELEELKKFKRIVQNSFWYRFI